MKKYEIVLTPGVIKLNKNSKWQHCLLQIDSIGSHSVKQGYLITSKGTLQPIKQKNIYNYIFLSDNIFSYHDGQALFRGSNLTVSNIV